MTETNQPTEPGWAHMSSDPDGVERWWSGVEWSQYTRTTVSVAGLRDGEASASPGAPVHPNSPSSGPGPSARADDAESAQSAHIHIQPSPPGWEERHAEPAIRRQIPTDPIGAAMPPTQEIQPIPPSAADLPTTAEATAPPSLYDVPWQPADDTTTQRIDIRSEIADDAPGAAGGERELPSSWSERGATRHDSVALGYEASAGVPLGTHIATPSYASPDRPRRAGAIAALVAAAAIILVGGGVIAMLAGGRTGSDESTATGEVRVPSDSGVVVEPSVLPPASTPGGGTTAPPSTTPPSSVVPTTVPPQTDTTVPGDLALPEPMRRPACDGQFIVITANAVTPGEYQRQVAEAQQRFIGSAYLKTDQTCSSLRPVDDAGNAIYSIYYGPFPTLEETCAIRAQVGGDAYVKVLDETTPSSRIWDC